jgi:hypothetical protein
MLSQVGFVKGKCGHVCIKKALTKIIRAFPTISTPFKWRKVRMNLTKRKGKVLGGYQTLNLVMIYPATTVSGQYHKHALG